jgi:hypothetical protein
MTWAASLSAWRRPRPWLRREGVDVRSVDLAKETLDPDVLRSADLVAFHLPMHTATRLAAPVIKKARAMNPLSAHLRVRVVRAVECRFLRSLGVERCVGR